MQSYPKISPNIEFGLTIPEISLRLTGGTEFISPYGFHLGTKNTGCIYPGIKILRKLKCWVTNPALQVQAPNLISPSSSRATRASYIVLNDMEACTPALHRTIRPPNNKMCSILPSLPASVYLNASIPFLFFLGCLVRCPGKDRVITKLCGAKFQYF